MNKEKNVWAIASLIAFWWLAPNQINAQQDSTTSVSLDNVVVTATKVAKSQTETGKVLTVIDENQIKQSAGKDLSQLLNEQAGLFINGANSSPGKDKSVYLRGAKSDYALVLLDGIPLNDPSSIGGGAYDFRLIPMDQIERIEILKGNQSTLYGSNAIAGVINIITKKDGAKPIIAAATVNYGSFNTFKSAVSLSGSKNKIAYNVGATRLSTDGISEAKDTLKQVQFEKDGLTQNTFNSSVTYKPIKGVQIEPYFRYAAFDGNYDDGIFNDNPDNKYTSSFRNAGAAAQYEFGKGSLHVFYGYDKTNRTFLDSAYGASRFKGRFHHGEAFLNYRLAKNFELLAGANIQKWHMLDETATEKNPSTELLSSYASFFLRNLKGFSAELGGRFNHHSKYGNNFTYSFNPSYLIKSSVKIFVNVSTGFKAPSLQQLYGAWGSNKNLKPETSVNSEVGVQFFLKQKLDIRVVTFARRIDAIIFYGPQGYINLNEQNDNGIDVEASWSVNQNLRAKAFYSYVDGRQVIEDAPDKNNLYRIPKNTIGLNVQYRVLPNWSISLNYKFTGTRTDLFYNSTTFNNQEVKLKSFQSLEFYTEYALLKNKLKVFVDAKNLLNQHYYEVYGYTVLPINVQGGVSTRL